MRRRAVLVVEYKTIDSVPPTHEEWAEAIDNHWRMTRGVHVEVQEDNPT